MLTHLLDPDEYTRRDPEDFNPPCIACGDEIDDGDLHNKIGSDYYCSVCWANPFCVKCDKPIWDERPVEIPMLVMSTGKYDTWHFHESCHSDWKAEEGGDYEPFGDGWRERVTQ